MRILLILLLLLANLMLFGANHQMFGPVPSAGLRNPAPLARELNPSGMHIRPMAPGEYIDHPVVGPADPTIKVRQEDLAPSALPPANSASGVAAGPMAASAASGAAAQAASSSAAASAPVPVSASTAHKAHHPRHKHS